MNSFNGELIESGVRVSISHGLFRVWETCPQFSKGETYTVDEAVAYANGNYETLPRSLLKELDKELVYESLIKGGVLWLIKCMWII